MYMGDIRISWHSCWRFNITMSNSRGALMGRLEGLVDRSVHETHMPRPHCFIHDINSIEMHATSCIVSFAVASLPSIQAITHVAAVVLNILLLLGRKILAVEVLACRIGRNYCKSLFLVVVIHVQALCCPRRNAQSPNCSPSSYILIADAFSTRSFCLFDLTTRCASLWLRYAFRSPCTFPAKALTSSLTYIVVTVPHETYLPYLSPEKIAPFLFSGDDGKCWSFRPYFAFASLRVIFSGHCSRSQTIQHRNPFIRIATRALTLPQKTQWLRSHGKRLPRCTQRKLRSFYFLRSDKTL
nr:hypothetical protein CFP56_12048 [Quercus suber]